MRTVFTVAIVAILSSVAARAETEKGLVAQWNFDEGKGDMLHDRSGNKNHGKIHGAKWVKCAKGYALEFDGKDDYVDCGNTSSLDISGPMTLEAWVCPRATSQGEPGIVGKFYTSYALTYYKDGRCYWYISHGGNHCKIAIDGGSWSHVVGTFDGNTMELYVNGEMVCSKKSRYQTMNRGKNFLIGCIVGDPAATDPNLTRTAHFKGMIDDVRVYTRALLEKEIVRHYNRKAREKMRSLLDASWMDRLKLTPYFYFHENKLLVDIDLRGVMPLPEHAELRADLVSVRAEKPLQSRKIKAGPKAKNAEVSFALAELAPGAYEVRAILKDKTGIRSAEKLGFQYPPPSLQVPSPEKKVVPPLPPTPEPVKYGFELCKAGGFSITVKGDSYPIESWYSYPYGGENRLTASEKPYGKGQKSWKVKTKKINATEYTVAARGKYYTIDRIIELHRNHVTVKDTITNNTAEDIGIIIHNHSRIRGTEGGEFTRPYLAGHKTMGKREGTASPSVFVGKKRLGIGLVPLDDVYVFQSCVYFENGLAGISTDKFGLAGNAAYTLEWAVYPNGTGDYYDFINAVRKDEGRNAKIDGVFAITPRRPLSREYVELRGLKYGSFGCLAHCADDRGISIEGVEFVDFPKEMGRLKRQIAAIHKLHPDLKVMFHVAHSLYATNKPERFADSRVISSNGKQAVWSTNRTYMEKYFSKENLDAGWDWWIFYPAADNSFRQAMLRSVDVMMDEIGCDGVFMDGFMAGYKGRYTYDRWDGHTVEIDPKTKTIRRKMASVLLLAQPALIEFARKMKAKGGVVVADNCVMTRTLAKEDILFCWEVHTGPYVHLAPTPAGRGNPRRIKNQLDVYRDVLDKLKWGMLYFYYGEKGITHKSVPSQMYPITIQEIHSGYVKGKERLVTMHNGVYGWPNDRDLHFAYRYDGRGVPIPHDFLTTVDAEGVRTEIALKKSECAVLKKVPITLRSRSPINLIAQQYESNAIHLILNGKGKADIAVRDGDFPVKARAAYVVEADTAKKIAADEEGRLSFRIALDGQLKVTIEPAAVR